MKILRKNITLTKKTLFHFKKSSGLNFDATRPTEDPTTVFVTTINATMIHPANK